MRSGQTLWGAVRSRPPLIEKGADVNAKDDEVKTRLAIALENRNRYGAAQ